jgi:glycosyltransferase involved in cell wall biosynthesis
VKILQLVSDWKWTGPAEPMLVLSAALRARGHQVDLVCPEPPGRANRSLWQEACLRGLDPIQSIESGRSAWRAGDFERVARLGDWLETDELGGPYDIVHCWHGRDHVLAARALGLGRPLARAARSARLVRFLSHADPLRGWLWNRWLFGPACDGLICVNDATTRALRPWRRGRAVASTTGAVDFDALAVHQPAHEIRRQLGIPADAPLIGVVARMQAHRRFDLLLESLARVVRRHPDVRLLVLGRGTQSDAVVGEPARALGLSDHVVRAGYRVEDYADLLAATDLFTFLVPGSDGTCRALLQAAALGLPMVGTRRGAIPEIISNGQTGMLVDEDPAALAGAWSALIEDPARRRAMGEAARRDARARFEPDRHASWVERFYEEVRAQSA